MNRLLKWWFNRKPYIPAVLRDVDPVVVDKTLDEALAASSKRIDVAAQQSRTMTASVVNLHNDFLKLIEGNRA